MDFAIIETGSKQYKITNNSTLLVDKIEGVQGSKITFDKVLMIVDGDDIQIGNPYLEGVSFEAELESQEKGEKIRILRFKAKSRHRRRQGFRQSLTKVSFDSSAKKTVSAKKEETVVKKEISKKLVETKAVTKKLVVKKVVAKKPVAKKTPVKKVVTKK